LPDTGCWPDFRNGQQLQEIVGGLSALAVRLRQLLAAWLRKERKHFTPEEKVAILRRHLVDKVPVSELCEELGLRPTVFYRWQKELFENGAAAFQSQQRPHRQVEEKQKPIEFLEKKADQGRGLGGIDG
jgi:transposase